MNGHGDTDRKTERETYTDGLTVLIGLAACYSKDIGIINETEMILKVKVKSLHIYFHLISTQCQSNDRLW